MRGHARTALPGRALVHGSSCRRRARVLARTLGVRSRALGNGEMRVRSGRDLAGRTMRVLRGVKVRLVRARVLARTLGVRSRDLGNGEMRVRSGRGLAGRTMCVLRGVKVRLARARVLARTLGMRSRALGNGEMRASQGLASGGVHRRQKNRLRFVRLRLRPSSSGRVSSLHRSRT
jgi:hypothetical protein